MSENLILPDPQPTRSDAVRNRALLLDTARRLFAEQGVEAVSMTAIAEAAGVGKGTLYRHFENKTQLSHALLDENHRDFQERTLRRLRMHSDPMENLSWFLTEVLRYVEANLPLLCVGDTGSISSLEHPANWWHRQTIRGLLEQIQPDGDLDYMTDVLYVLVDVHTFRFQHGAQGYDTPRIVDGIKSILFKLTGYST